MRRPTPTMSSVPQWHRFWDVYDDAPARKVFWLGPGAQGWVRDWLARRVDSAGHAVHRIPAWATRSSCSSASDDGVLLMDPIYGHVTEPWDWFLGPGAQRDDEPFTPNRCCHFIEAWYKPAATENGRVRSWGLAGAGGYRGLVERLVRVVTQPVAVCLPVAADLLGRLAQGLAHVLKAVALIEPAHHDAAQARSGSEAHQQGFLVGVLVVAVSFEQIRHFPWHPFMMPRQVVASPYCHIV